jgi:AcrR family transcriptional regulator
VPIKEIARRAGVSHGTVYNLFGSREALIDEVVAEFISARLAEAVGGALGEDDPWEGFVKYVEALCALMATDRVMADALSGRAPGASRVADICEASHEAGMQVIDRALRAGALRADFQGTDLVFVFGGQAALAPAAEAAVPGSWRRGVRLLLDGLRASSAHEIEVPPLTRPQMYDVNARLGRPQG